MEEGYIQIGAIGIIFVFAIKEFFSYLAKRKNGGGYFNENILKQLELMNGNHLHGIQKAIEDGSKTNHEDHTGMAVILGEIRGKLK